MKDKITGVMIGSLLIIACLVAFLLGLVVTAIMKGFVIVVILFCLYVIFKFTRSAKE